MSAQEILQLLHALIDTYQVALSSFELMEDLTMPVELRRHVRIGKAALKRGISVMRRMQDLARALVEDERESIQ